MPAIVKSGSRPNHRKGAARRSSPMKLPQGGYESRGVSRGNAKSHDFCQQRHADDARRRFLESGSIDSPLQMANNNGTGTKRRPSLASPSSLPRWDFLIPVYFISRQRAIRYQPSDCLSSGPGRSACGRERSGAGRHAVGYGTDLEGALPDGYGPGGSGELDLESSQPGSSPHETTCTGGAYLKKVSRGFGGAPNEN
jgi:hypothetical protein